MHDLDISLIIDDSTILLIPITSTGINESLSNLELGWITLLFSFSILKTSFISKSSIWSPGWTVHVPASRTVSHGP